MTVPAPAFWGARVLSEYWDKKRHFSTLWDRQDGVGSLEDRTALQKKLNDGAIDALFKHLEKELLDDEDTHEIILKGVRFWYSTRRSSGYVYVTACID